MLTGDAKWGALRGCEAFVLPSHGENFGVAVVEAMACGRPVIISDRVNIGSIVAAAGAGLVGPDTACGTERLLVDYLGLPLTDRIEMGRNARRCYEDALRHRSRHGAHVRSPDGGGQQMTILSAHLARPLEGGPSFPLWHRLFRLVWQVAWLLLAAWTPPPLRRWRRLVLHLFGARLGRSADVRASARVWYPPHLTMGDCALIGPGALCYNIAPIKLGDVQRGVATGSLVHRVA